MEVLDVEGLNVPDADLDPREVSYTRTDVTRMRQLAKVENNPRILVPALDLDDANYMPEIC